MDFRAEIGEGSAKGVVKDPDAVFIWSGVWLGRVVNEVVSEKLFEELEVPAALYFFGIAADDRFRGLGEVGRALEHPGIHPQSIQINVTRCHVMFLD